VACIHVCFALRRPSGPSGISFTGGTGPTGSQGLRGFGFINDGSGILDEAVVASISSSSTPFRYIVTNDQRLNMGRPPALAGNQSQFMIYWTGSRWFSIGYVIHTKKC
jgi:hypothetical protein